MLIHNVYSDLLSSSTYFLNNFILSDHHIKIKSFQYNIGNSSFQLEYGSQHELPAAIVTLQSITPFINHPYVFHRNICSNMNKIPVIYDRTKDIEIFLQEEMYTVAVTININCDSQLQALEIQHRIMNYIPLNKYLQAYKFTSFFELDPNLLSKYLIDVKKDKIENLFYKQNKYTDTFDYCFSVEYEPLIRINSCDIGIDSSVNSSFQVACSIEFLTHIPIYLDTPKVNWTNLVNENYLQYNDVPVAVKDDIDNILVELYNSTTNTTYKEIWQLNNGMINGEFKYVNRVLSVSTLYNKKKIDALIHLRETISGEIIHSECFIEGDNINGFLRQINILDNSTLTAYFDGICGGKHIKDFFNFEFVELDSIKVAGDLLLNIPPPLELLEYKVLPKKPNILNSIKNINRSAVKINPSRTYITKYIDLNNNLVILSEPHYINQYSHEFILPNNISGTIDLDTFDIVLYGDVKYLYINLSFDFISGIPARIERVNYNFNATEQIIVNRSPYSTLKELNEMPVAIISNLNFNEELSEISFNLGTSTREFNFKFINQNQMILDTNHMSLDLIKSTNDLLVFKLINNLIYYKHLSEVNTLNPLYFCYN